MKKLLLFSLLLSSFASAQQKKEARKYLRVLSLGDTYHWVEGKAEINGKRMRQQAALPPGVHPPSPLAITTSPGEVMSKTNPLRQLSEPYVFSAGLEKLTLSKGPQVGGKKWTTINVPKPSHSLLLCWREHGAKNWDTVKTIFLADSPKAFPAQEMRFINISDVPVAVILNGSRPKKYGPGKRDFLPLRVGRNSLVVKIPGKNGRDRTLKDEGINVTKKERVNLIIYKADGRSPRSRAKCWVQKEDAEKYQPPEKEPKKEEGDNDGV